MGPLTSLRTQSEAGIEGAFGEINFSTAGLPPGLPPGAGTAEGPTMVVPGPVALSLLLSSLALLVSHLSSSQDIASESSGEQQLCTRREHPIVAFEGERFPPPLPLVLKDVGQILGRAFWVV